MHGVKGQLVLKLTAEVKEEASVLFIEASGNKVPYFIEDWKETPGGSILRFEDVDDVDKARALCGKKVYADSGMVIEEEEAFNWLGFQIHDEKYGDLGAVVSVSHNGYQDLLHLQFRGKELLLPVVDDFIIEMKEEEKRMRYKAPEGLIEVYLDEGVEGLEDEGDRGDQKG